MSAGGRRAELSPTVRYLRAAASSDTLCVNWLLILGRSEWEPALLAQSGHLQALSARSGLRSLAFRHQRRVQNFPYFAPTRPYCICIHDTEHRSTHVPSRRAAPQKPFIQIAFQIPATAGPPTVKLHCPPFDLQEATFGGAATLRVRCQVRGSTLGRSIKQGRGSLLQTASRVAQ